MWILESIIKFKNIYIDDLNLIKFKLNTPKYLNLPDDTSAIIRVENLNFKPSEFLTYAFIISIFLLIFEIQKFSKVKKILLFIAPFYLVIKLIISYESFLELNQDSIAWIITSIRMDSLNTFEYLASWDHKGSTIYWIYLLIFKYFKISDNLWANYSLVFILWSLFITYLSSKYLNKNNSNKYTVYLISIMLFLNLTFTPEAQYPVFDSRFVGSSFVFIGIYCLIDEKYKLSSFFLALSILTLPTFALSSFAIFFITVYKNLNSKISRFLEIVMPYFFVFIGYIIYLFFTSQMDEFLRLVIKFNLNLNGVGEYYPLIYVIQSNLYLVCFFVITLVFFKKLYKKFGDKYLLIEVWSICAFLHLVLTGPRYYQYDQLLVIPLSLTGFFAFYVVYDILRKARKSNVFLKLFLIIFTFLPLSVFSYSITTALEIKPVDIFGAKDKVIEVLHFEEDSKIYKKEPVLAIFFIEGKDWQYIHSNYNFLPSTRFWQIFWNKRDFGWPREFNWELIITDEEYETLLIDDLKTEDPRYAVVNVNYNSSHKNILYDYILKNYNLESCDERNCIYIKK